MSAPNVTIDNLITQLYVESAIFVLQGIVQVGGNLWLLAAMSVSKELRTKEYVLPCGLAVADLFVGCNQLSAGLWRIYTNYHRITRNPVNPMVCLMKPMAHFCLLGAFGVPTMLVLISVDRLIACISIQLYSKIRTRHALCMVLAGYGLTFALYVTSISFVIITSAGTSHTATESCVLGFVLPNQVTIFYYFYQMVLGLASVLLYAVAFAAMRGLKISAMSEVLQASSKLQAKVTRTLAYVMGCTAVLYVLPLILLLVIILTRFTTPLYWLGQMLWITMNLNSANNFIIYLIKNKDIRQGMWRVIGIKPAASNAVVTINARRTFDH